MQRWFPTASLAGAAALVAYLVGPLSPFEPPSTPRTTPDVPDPVPPDEPASRNGILELRANLDQEVFLPEATEDRYLVIRVTAPQVESPLRQPVDVAVVMDTSGSMSGRGKMEYARLAAREMVEQLGYEDRFALVTFSDRANTPWPARSVSSRHEIFETIASIRAGGGTNMYEGLTAGFDALGQGDPNRVRRLVLLSDGHANIGLKDPASLSGLVARGSESGIGTSTVGLGLDYNEDLLATMADAGGGDYTFVDHPSTLSHIFSEELDGMTRAVARGTTLHVELEPGVVARDVFGYAVDDLSRRSFELFFGDLHAGQTRKAVLRLDVPAGTGDHVELAEVSLRYQDLVVEPTSEATEQVAVVGAYTSSERVAEASVDREASVQAARARAAAMAHDAARAFEQEDRQTARTHIAEVRTMLRQVSSSLNAPELLEDEATYAQAADIYPVASPQSAEGKRALKVQKEKSREYAH